MPSGFAHRYAQDHRAGRQCRNGRVCRHARRQGALHRTAASSARDALWALRSSRSGRARRPSPALAGWVARHVRRLRKADKRRAAGDALGRRRRWRRNGRGIVAIRRAIRHLTSSGRAQPARRRQTTRQAPSRSRRVRSARARRRRIKQPRRRTLACPDVHVVAARITLGGDVHALAVHIVVAGGRAAGAADPDSGLARRHNGASGIARIAKGVERPAVTQIRTQCRKAVQRQRKARGGEAVEEVAHRVTVCNSVSDNARGQ